MNYNKQQAQEDESVGFDTRRAQPSAHKLSKPSFKNKVLWALQHTNTDESTKALKTLIQSITRMGISELRDAIRFVSLAPRYLFDTVKDDRWFDPISESVGNTGAQKQADYVTTPPKDWWNSEAPVSPDILCPLRKSTFFKLPETISNLFLTASNAAAKVRVGNLGLNTSPYADPNYDGTQPHGFNFAPDVSFAKYLTQIQESVLKELQKALEDRLKVLDAYTPVTSNVTVEDNGIPVKVDQESAEVDINGYLKSVESPTNEVLTPEE